jgi:hypothetical protein
MRIKGLSDTDMAKRIGLFLYIVTLRLKVGIVEPQEASIVKQRLGKHVYAAINAQDTRDIVGNDVFGSCKGLIKEELSFEFCLPVWRYSNPLLSKGLNRLGVSPLN